MRAYEYYLRGRQLAHQARRESLDAALRMFGRAVEIDPTYARAVAAAADCHSWLYMYHDATDARLGLADEASRRALELDPESGEAHASRGFVLSLSRRYDEACAELTRAVELSPTLFEAHYLFGRVSWAMGRLEDAARHFEQAAAVRPEDFQTLMLLITVYQAIEPARALEAARRAVANVREHLELYPTDMRARYHGAIALRQLGQETEARAWADRVLAAEPDDSSTYYNLGCFYALGGDADRAFDCMYRAIAKGFAHREWAANDSDLVGLHGDPRWPELLDRFASAAKRG
jgi:adenylate cyclase